MALNIFQLIPILFLFLFTNPSYAIPDLQIKSICETNPYRDVCNNFIDSIPNLISADLHVVLGHTLDHDQSAAKDALDKFTSLAKNTTDADLKTKYSSCVENYNNATKSFEEAQKYFAAKDYRNVSEQISSVLSQEKTCFTNLSLKGIPAPPILRLNLVVDLLSNIILVIAKLFPTPE